MTLHIRKQIRDRGKLQLTGLPTTGAHVFTGNPYPLDRNQMPGLVVSIPSEAAWENGSSFGVDGRMGEFVIMAYAEGVDVEDTLDAIAIEVETALGNDRRLGGLVKNIETPPRMQRAFSEDGAKRSGEMRLSFPISYRTPTGQPGAST